LADLEFSPVEEHNRSTQVAGQWVGWAAGDQALGGRVFLIPLQKD